MDPERWQRIEALFEAAADLAPAEREALLDQACAGDATLRQEVDALLAADATAAGSFGAALGHELSALEAEDLRALAARLQQGLRYQIGEPLGRGGMGVVFAAYDPELERKIALKILHREEPSTIDRLLREARAQARVEHTHVCRVYDVGRVHGTPYVAMQRIDGPSLSVAAASMAVAEKVRVVAQVAEAVHAAHDLGLLHRDLKPSNILVERGEGGWHPFVLDFGIAHELGAAATADGLVGTPRYMAPEQARGRGEPLDRGVDVWALGVTLYELLTGKPPFAGETALDTLDQILRAEPEPVRRRDPRLAVDLETVVMKCLEREPRDRYESAHALAQDLERYLAGEPIAARPASLAYRLSRRVRRHKLATALLAGAALLAALGVAAGRRLVAPKWLPSVHEMTPAYDENSNFAVFSPDGTMVAYDSDRDDPNGDFHVYVGPTAGGPARMVTPPGMHASRPRFTADGQALLFRSGDTAIARVSLSDGKVSPVAEALYADACGERLIIGYSHAEGCPECFSLVLREADGREHERLRIPREKRLKWLRCDRAGRSAVYVVSERSSAFHTPASVWMLHIGGGDPVELLEEPALNPFPSFHPDGRSILFSSARGGASNLWELPLAGGPAAQVTLGGGPDFGADVSADGRLVIFDVDVTITALFAVPLDGGSPRRLSLTMDDTVSIQVAPDGRALALQVRRAGRSLVIVRDLESGAETTLGEGATPVFTPGGREVVWSAGERLLAAPRSGGPPRALASLPGRAEVLGLGEDGLIHVTVAWPQHVEPWHVPLAGGAGEREAGEPYSGVIPAPRGGWLAALLEGGNAIELVPPGEQPGAGDHLRLRATAFAWDAAGTSFVYRGLDAGIHRRDLLTRTDLDLPKPRGTLFTMAVAPDGRTLYASIYLGQVRRQLITNFGVRPRQP